MGSKLGGLPELGYGPVYAEQAPIPKPDQSGGIFSAIADGAEDIRKQFQPALDEEAAKKGADSVTRDAQGNLQSAPQRMVLSEADKYYENAAHLKYMSEAALDIRPKIGALQEQYKDDPDGFKIGLQNLTIGATQNAPAQFQRPLTDMILQQGNAAQADLVNQKLQRDTIEARQSVDTVLTSHENSLAAYARQNKLDDPQAQVLMKEYIDLNRAKVANKAFNYSQAQADQDVSEFTSQLKAQAIIGKVGDLYVQMGEQKAELEAERLLDDPALNLSPKERNTFSQQAREQIRILHAGTRDQQNELQRQVEYRLDDANAAALATGDWTKVVSPDDITRAYASDLPRAAQIIGRLNASSEVYSMRKSVAMATPQQLAQMDLKYNPQSNGAGQTPTGFNSVWSKFTAPHEGGYTAADSNGQPANFGINQGANPDIDVKNLTAAQAAQIAKDRYWGPSGAQALSPALAAVQFDTAFNMGLPAAQELLAKSGGDASTYLNLREQRYRQIAAKDPTKAAQLPNWLQRNTDLRNFVSGGDIANQVREYGAFQEALQQRQQALTKDPAAYVLGNRPDVSQLLSSNDPGQVQNGVRSLLSIQRDLGVINPRILSKTEEQAIVASFDNPANPAKRADGMNAVIDTVASRYGSYFPQVMKDLQNVGLPPEAASLYLVRGQGATAVRMATAINSMSQMGKDLNAGRDQFFSNAPGNADIRRALPGVMDDYIGTMHGVADGPQQIVTMQNAIALLSRQYAYEGLDPNKAVQKAHDDLIGAKYNFVDTYRVPRGIDQSAIQSGANAFKAGLKAENLEPYTADFYSPTLGRQASASMNDRQVMSQRILSTQGIWVTRSDDKGLTLVWPQSSGFKPVTDAKGNPVSLSWGALQGYAKPSLFKRAVSSVGPTVDDANATLRALP